MAHGRVNGTGSGHYVQGAADDHQEAHNFAGSLDALGNGHKGFKDAHRMLLNKMEGVGIHHHPAAGRIFYPVKNPGRNDVAGHRT